MVGRWKLKFSILICKTFIHRCVGVGVWKNVEFYPGLPDIAYDEEKILDIQKNKLKNMYYRKFNIN